MKTPDWWQLALLALAAFRIWKLIGDDVILDRPREWLLKRLPEKDLGAFLTCPWCAGFWIALAWWGAWQAWPHGALAVATPWALSAVVGFLGSLSR